MTILSYCGLRVKEKDFSCSSYSLQFWLIIISGKALYAYFLDLSLYWTGQGWFTPYGFNCSTAKEKELSSFFKIAAKVFD